jgi:hypothetical protein
MYKERGPAEGDRRLQSDAALGSDDPVSARRALRRNLFGRPDLADTYRRARDRIVELGIFRVARVEHLPDGARQVDICNLWRITRHAAGNVSTFERSIETGEWIAADSLRYWPSVPIAPVSITADLGWWRDVARQAIWKVLIGCGYSQLPKHLSEVEWDEERVGVLRAGSPKPDMSPNKMAYRLIGRYIGRGAPGQGYGRPGADTATWRPGVLRPELMLAGARALRAAVFEHLLDKEIISGMLAARFASVTLSDYLRHARDRDAFLRVAREHRNLLPLMAEISPAYWQRKDLFSRGMWVRDGRKRTVVDYKRFGATEFARFTSFESKAAFRWLLKAPLTVVRTWGASGGDRNPTPLENIARADITVHVPAIVWCHIIRSEYDCRPLGVRDPVRKLYRAFVSHCAMVWKRDGFAALKAWLRTDEAAFGDIVDWLAAEGVVAGYPDKHATWESLRRRSAEWHERVSLRSIDQVDDRAWLSLVPQTIFDGITVTPLSTARDLALDGWRQHHCVATYVSHCVDGTYRVYSIVEPDGTSSTAGLWLTDQDGWTLQQHRGKYNGSVSVEASAAAKHLVLAYRAAFRAS